MLAYRSGVSAVAVEASMDNARKEGNLELTEVLRSLTAAEGIPEGFHLAKPGRVVLGGGEQRRHASAPRPRLYVLGNLNSGEIKMTQQTYPRSPKALLGGIAHLGRFIDKIRLRHAKPWTFRLSRLVTA